jgi:transcriptional regulator with XRE-family HTH domain
MELKDRLLELRINFPLKQSEIADKLGISESTYQNYERGRMANPRL